MNILHISGVNNWGGGENHIENLCAELAKSNPEVKNIILCRKGSKFHSRLKLSNFNFKTSPLTINFDPRFIWKIIKLCKSKQIDLIHIHDPRAMALVILADQMVNLPPFIFSKKISFPVKKRKQTLYKYNYPKIKKYLCVSNQTREIMSEAILDKKKLTTIYHGTRIDNKDDVTPFQLRERFAIGPDQIIIGNIANHQKAKNLETFIAVADYLINSKGLKQFRFIQIGSFTDRTPALQSRVKELNLEDHLHFLGYTPKASNFLPQFNISMITSTNEGLPQVIYESFYHKVPVISTNVAGIPEVIKNGENGLLAERRDYIKLGEHILYLYKNQELINRFTKTSHSTLLENFTTTNMAVQTLAEYKSILNGRS